MLPSAFHPVVVSALLDIAHPERLSRGDEPPDRVPDPVRGTRGRPS